MHYVDHQNREILADWLTKNGQFNVFATVTLSISVEKFPGNSVQKFPPRIMRLSGLCAGESGVLIMDLIAKIRFRRSVGKESISSIARDLNLSRPTVRKHCRTQTEPIYRGAKQPTPRLGAF